MHTVIFDFNGTLFRDSELHEQAWRQFVKELTGRSLTQADFDQIHGRSNHLIFENLLGKPLTLKAGEELSNQKEAIYRQLVHNEKKPQLIQGVPAYFNFLQEKKIPMNIATASPKVNVDFYFDLFHLQQWFDYEKVIYNDGRLNSKPAPDFYLQAVENIVGRPQEMIVFEDAPLGLQGAHNAHAQHIIAVATGDNHEKLEKTGVIDFVIEDFTDSRIRKFFLTDLAF